MIDGPFTESKELVAGYWIIQAKSLAEAVEWAKRVPFDTGDGLRGEPEIEIRQIYELVEFGDSAAVEQARQLEKELAKNKA